MTVYLMVDDGFSGPMYNPPSLDKENNTVIFRRINRAQSLP